MRPTRAPGRGRGRTVLARVAAGAMLVAGCGVQLDDAPRPIASPGSTTSTSSTTTPGPDAQDVGVYFLDGDRLVRRAIAVGDDPSIAQALTFVLDAPAEDIQGLTTAIPPGTRLIDLTIEGELATVDLSSEINDVDSQPQKQAFAQLVFTVLDSREVRRIRFLVDGELVAAPTDLGNLEVVRASDYEPPLNPW